VADLSRLSELIPPHPGSADWSIPTRIRVGPGRVAELPDACAETGIARPLVVSDAGLAVSGVLDLAVGVLEHSLGSGRPAVFDGVVPDPDQRCVDTGLLAYRTAACDGIIAIGGGSVLDAAKLIALASAGLGPLLDFADGADGHRRRGPIPPVIAVPTTAGTGSEVGRAAVLSDPGISKTIIFHPRLMPASVICDAALTIGLPRAITVATGMDALSHALEAWCSPQYHPSADAIAAESARLALSALPIVADDPTHLGARQQMMVAALMAATAFQKGLGVMHALSHPIGAVHGTHHGLTNAVLMPAALWANRSAIEAKLGRLATSIGIEGQMDGFVETIVRLRATLGVPATLADLGVPSGPWDEIISAAVLDPSAATNPLPVTAEFASAVLERAWHGS
jgi:alcohol dehydrogenase class IV